MCQCGTKNKLISRYILRKCNILHKKKILDLLKKVSMPFLKKQDKTLINLSKQVQRLAFRECFLNYVSFILIKKNKWQGKIYEYFYI